MTSAKKEIDAIAKAIEAEAKEKILAEARHQYNLRRSYEYNFALDRKRDIKKKLSEPLFLGFTQNEIALINSVDDLISSCKTLSSKLAELDNRIAKLNRDIDSAREKEKSFKSYLNSASESFRTVAIPDLITLHFLDAPQKDRLNDFYHTYTAEKINRDNYTFDADAIIKNFHKKKQNLAETLAESENLRNQIVRLESDLIDAENQREETFDELKKTMTNAKTTLPKLKSLVDAYDNAKTKRQADVEKELADFDAQLKIDFPEYFS